MSCKESIEGYKDNSDELSLAYRFVFGAKGRQKNIKGIKESLLRFNGYLPKPDKGAEKKDIEKVETPIEVCSSSSDLLCPLFGDRFVEKNVNCGRIRNFVELTLFCPFIFRDRKSIRQEHTNCMFHN